MTGKCPNAKQFAECGGLVVRDLNICQICPEQYDSTNGQWVCSHQKEKIIGEDKSNMSDLLQEIKKHVDSVELVNGVYWCEKEITTIGDECAEIYHTTIIIDNDKIYIKAKGPLPSIFENITLPYEIKEEEKYPGLYKTELVKFLKNIESYIFPKQKEKSDKKRIKELEEKLDRKEIRIGELQLRIEELKLNRDARRKH